MLWAKRNEFGMNALLGHRRVARSHNDENPKTENGQEVDREHDTPEPDIAGKDLDSTMQYPAGDEDPG